MFISKNAEITNKEKVLDVHKHAIVEDPEQFAIAVDPLCKGQFIETVIESLK